MKKLHEIILNHGEIVMDVCAFSGHMYLVYGDDSKYICPCDQWHIVEPVLNTFMSYAYNFNTPELVGPVRTRSREEWERICKPLDENKGSV